MDFTNTVAEPTIGSPQMSIGACEVQKSTAITSSRCKRSNSLKTINNLVSMFYYKVPKLNLRFCPSKATFREIQVLSYNYSCVAVNMVCVLAESFNVTVQKIRFLDNGKLLFTIPCWAVSDKLIFNCCGRKLKQRKSSYSWSRVFNLFQNLKIHLYSLN